MNKLRRGILICLAALCLTGACALGETLYLPENLKRIDQEAFYQTVNVDEVVLPEGVTAIGPRAFAESLISRIYLPESLTDIAADAFSSCDNLTAVVHEDSYAHVWCQENGVEFEVIAAPVPYTTQVQANGTLAITGYTGEETALVIPAYVNGVSVTAVADGAFKDNTAIVSVELPATLTTIADEALSGCLNLEKVTATEESWLASVGSRAFYQCKKLAQFPFTDTLEKIGDEAFSMANIVEADLSSVSGLGKDAFAGAGAAAFSGSRGGLAASVTSYSGRYPSSGGGSGR